MGQPHSPQVDAALSALALGLAGASRSGRAALISQAAKDWKEIPGLADERGVNILADLAVEHGLTGADFARAEA